MESRRDKNSASRREPASASTSTATRESVRASRERFCDYLVGAREQSGKSLDDIAGITRIPIRSLERLEAGEFERLPADVFVRGFLRSYARCVGLDVDETIRRYGECGMTPAPVASAMADELVGSLATLDSSSPPSYRVSRAATPPEGSPRSAMRMALATPATGAPAAVQALGTGPATSSLASSEAVAGAPAGSSGGAVAVGPAPHDQERQERSAVAAVVDDPAPAQEPVQEIAHARAREPGVETEPENRPPENRPVESDGGIPEPVEASESSRASTQLSRNARKRLRKKRKRKRQTGATRITPAASAAARADAVSAESADRASEPADAVAMSAVEPAVEQVGESSGAARAVIDATGSSAACENPETNAVAANAVEANAVEADAVEADAVEADAVEGSVVASVPFEPSRKLQPRPMLVIDDDCPDEAERIREAREAARERDDATWRNFLPPSLLDSEQGSRRGALTLAVIILVIVATLTMSYLMRRPNDSGDGVTRGPIDSPRGGASMSDASLNREGSIDSPRGGSGQGIYLAS